MRRACIFQSSVSVEKRRGKRPWRLCIVKRLGVVPRPMDRGFLAGTLALLLAVLWGLVAGTEALANPPIRISVSVPGPGNVTFLPADLIKKIGADAAEGIDLRVLSVSGGGAALKNLNTRNSDFALLGMPAIMSQRANNVDVVAIAPVSADPLWVLMVRKDLRDTVRTVADLKGRVIGVTSGTPISKTTSQQVIELLLGSAGVGMDQVRFLTTGKSWEEQAASILMGTVDAIMGDEPFATRLEAGGRVFALANPAIPALAPDVPGTGFLFATLATRSDMITEHPERAAKMVRILRQTLEWMKNHSSAEIVEKLDIETQEERQALLACLSRYQNLYSPDARFSSIQLRETEIFFRAVHPGEATRGLAIETVVNDRWAGRKP